MGELIGIANKHDCRMSCEENDIMLPYIIAKVAEGKAGITISELSVLLRLQYESTKKVSRIAVAEYGVDIDFQDVI